MQKKPDFTCWIVTEGMAGTENQCIGVADFLKKQLCLTVGIKKISLNPPWSLLSPYLGFEQAGTFSPALRSPWPDILITSGRKAIAAARYIKKQSKGRTFTLHVQDPRISPTHFDLIAVPKHDPTRGDNVIVSVGAPNKITPEKLETAKKEFPQFGDIEAPKVAVLIGGTSKAYIMSQQVTHRLADQLARLDAGLMITASRRTGKVNQTILLHALSDTDAFVWDGTGANPYMAFLAWADYILVTADSVSMLCEACTTGKPVYMIPMEGGAPRIDALHQNLINHGAMRVFDGTLEPWDYTPLHDAEMIARETVKRFKQHLRAIN